MIHNAGILGPIGSLEGVTEDRWRETFGVNVEAPLFLTQKLLRTKDSKMGFDLIAPGARILQVGSGAAHHAIGGWTTYCSSKAAMHMLYQCLRDELKPQGVLVGSVR